MLNWVLLLLSVRLGYKTKILCKELVEMLGGNRDFMQGIS